MLKFEHISYITLALFSVDVLETNEALFILKPQKKTFKAIIWK